MSIPPPNQLKIIEDYLATREVHELKKKIAHYATQSQKPRAREQIRKEIFSVLKAPGGTHFVIPHSAHPILVDTPLFRARVIDNLSQLADEKDVWNSPPQYVSPGRLNVEGESLLYTAVGVPRTAAFEVRAKAGALVAMSEFKVLEQFNALRIGDEFLPDALSLKGRRKLSLIMNFMQDIFTQRSIPEDTHKYIAPELIAKDFFDLPSSAFQAWSFTSIADPSGTGWNLCFRPEAARKLLSYEKTQVVRLADDDQHSLDDLFRHQVVATLIKDPTSEALIPA